MKKSALLLFLSFGFLLPGYCQSLDVFGPKPFVQILDNDFTKSWSPTAISSVANLEYFVLLDADTKLKAIRLNGTDRSVIEVTDIANVNEGDATYGSLLRSIFQIVDINSNNTNDNALMYQIRPVLNTYAGLNYSDAKVVASDIGSYYVSDASSAGYLVIEITGTPSAAKLMAVKQYEYNSTSGALEENTSWTAQWLAISGESLALAAEANATTFFLADVNDLIDIKTESGSDFNPSSIDWQENAFAAYPDNVWKYSESDFYGSFLEDVSEDVQSQFGSSTEANTAASTALDAIETALNENGSTLRYDKSVYLAFRENLLSHTFASNDIYNGQLGENTVPYVYFTNSTDDSGVSHPFMVIASHNTSSGPNFLIDVARPPGDGLTGSYAEQSITRNAVLETQINKIPLKDYGLTDNLLDNDLSTVGNLAADEGLEEADYDVYNYTGTASMGVATDGVVVYPPYNNNLRFAPVDAEITVTGIHVGQGMGLHYHADGHGFTQSGINLYNLADYDSKNHPPLIAFAYDGIALFGRYEEAHSSMEGYSVALDEYGGHNHNDFGYHYHAFSKEFTVEVMGGGSATFNQNFLFVGAWKGKVNDIPGFAQGGLKVLKEDYAAYYGGSSEGGTTLPENVLGLDENPRSIQVYPNPNKGKVRISTQGISSVRISEINGKILAIKRVERAAKFLEFNGLPRGIYIVRGEGEKHSFTEKVVVQ